MRFNLHCSGGHFPLSIDIFDALLPYERYELQRELDDFKFIKAEYIKNLKLNRAKELESLQGLKVVFLGDSITSDNLGYRALVSEATDFLGYDCSISGATSSMLLHESKKCIEKVRPDIVSIMVGANDSVSIGDREFNQVSIEEYKRNIIRIVECTRQIETKVLLFEITPIYEKRFAESFDKEKKFQSNQNINRYNAVLKEIADVYGIKLISHDWISSYDDYDSLFEPDGIHLSVKAQKMLADFWLEVASDII